QALGAARPGDRICVSGDAADQRLTISQGGTAQAPVTVVGTGATAVKGISVRASNVVVDGFRVTGAQAPGIEIKGSNITVRNNTVSHPTGGDFDGLRFFGSNLRIVHNTIMNISPDGSGAHADCMQTFATDSDSPASQHVLIDGNRCQKIDNQCLIAEGPHSSAGDGSGQGTSADITFSNNICEVGASQATEIDDVQNVKVLNNLVSGKPDKAFSFQNKSTGAIVQANKIDSGIGYEVGMDATSKLGYRGPKIGGAP
ncbi:MAG TPA: right-handed parallel beta-helix repeat-containing protein, partial [Acidimicrobiales bacterium]